MPAIGQSLICTAVLGFALSPAASAVARRYVPDRELATRPVVVIARWPHAPILDHPREDESLYAPGPARTTQLVVERVLAGDISPGPYTLYLSSDAVLRSGSRPTLGEVLAVISRGGTWPEVEDATRPQLWFLSVPKREGASGPATTLSLDTGRGMQPMKLQAYFTLLRQADREERIVSLLDSRDPETVLRALRDISGGMREWKHLAEWSREYAWDRTNPAGTRAFHRPLDQHRNAVKALLASREPEVRRMAVATYAWLAGPESRPTMRRLRSDPDPAVREMAWQVLRCGGFWRGHPSGNRGTNEARRRLAHL